jgi:hypothetical protein
MPIERTDTNQEMPIERTDTNREMPILEKLSVCDIQGQWREKDTQKVWSVNGIVAERKKQTMVKQKPIVLSDGPAGVEWGNGNLKGSMEDGWLVWRNRRGEATYSWKKLESPIEATRTESQTEAAKPQHNPPIASSLHVPTKTNSQTKTENPSPRSTTSGTSNETAELTAGMGNLAAMADPVGANPDGIATAEVQMLIELARNRLLAGDVYMSMRYITLAQQVQPVSASFGY